MVWLKGVQQGVALDVPCCYGIMGMPMTKTWTWCVQLYWRQINPLHESDTFVSLHIYLFHERVWARQRLSATF